MLHERRGQLHVALETGVVVTPGVSYGAAGEGYIRLSYANSEANLETALGLMRQAVEAL